MRVSSYPTSNTATNTIVEGRGSRPHHLHHHHVEHTKIANNITSKGRGPAHHNAKLPMKTPRRNIASYRRTKRGGDFYDTWKGRISVHMKVKYFDLKSLVKNVLGKTTLLVEDGWEIMEFYDVIRLSLPSLVCPPTSSVVADVSSAPPPSDAFATVLPPPPPPRPSGVIRSSSASSSSPLLVSLLDEDQLITEEKAPVIFKTEAKQQNEDVMKEHLKSGLEEGPSTPEVYIFSFGGIVLWNFENKQSEEAWMSKYIFSMVDRDQERNENYDSEDGEVDAVGEYNPADAIESADDEVDFMYGTSFQIKSDVVELESREYGEKMALSFALSKSAMLSIFEWRLNQVIERNSYIPEQLVKNGHIPMSSKELRMEIGRIYLVKSGINLDNNVLDTPEELWEGKQFCIQVKIQQSKYQSQFFVSSSTFFIFYSYSYNFFIFFSIMYCVDDKYSREYEKAMAYFDIVSRLELVNARLEVMQDMNQILMDAAQYHHASLLEWAVIALIIVEILVEIFRTYRDSIGDF